MKESFLVPIVLLIVFFLIVGTAINSIRKKQCISAYSNFHPQYSLWTKCRIEINGILTPVDIVRKLR